MTAIPPPFDPASLGVDAAVSIYDFPGAWGLASGFANIANAHMRRITTAPTPVIGGLFYDPAYVCFDLFGLLNQSMAPTDIANVQAGISAAIMDDERVDSVDVTVTQNRATGDVTITIQETLANGQTFAFILLAANATLALLELDGVSVQAAVDGTAPSPGVQLVVGPPGAGLIGPQGPAGASGTPQWTSGPLGGTDEGSDSSGTESVTDQVWVNFGALPGTITVQLIGDCYTLGGATGTYRVRIGGTKNNADGTLVGTPATANAGTPTQKSITATIANPGGIQYVTVTAQTDTPGQAAVISEDRALTIR